jgi:formylglycine-generating enzyme required for sulfatase activity
LCCNRFGIFDMHGNEWEWCHQMFKQEYFPDRKLGQFRPLFDTSLRGGNYSTSLNGLTSFADISQMKNDIAQSGFRVALSFSGVTGDQSPFPGTLWMTPPRTLRVAEDIYSTTLERVRSELPANRVGAPPSPAIAPFGEPEAQRLQSEWATHLGSTREKDIIIADGQRLTMVLIPPGEFTRNEDSAASFRVRLTEPFFLGKYEVTQKQWQAVMGFNPSRHKTSPMAPVENVSWLDVESFIGKLNGNAADHSWRFALPTEAQWEIACRAGTTTAYSFGEASTELTQHAWCRDNNPGSIPKPVGLLRANPFGLHDMHGNVWEHCRDWFSQGYYEMAPIEDPSGPAEGSHKVGRGGWSTTASNLSSSFRGKDPPDARNGVLGFRVALIAGGNVSKDRPLSEGKGTAAVP